MKKKVRLSLIEPLEDRIAPAAFTVLNTNDSGAGSLRQAILDSDSAGGSNTIAFNIPGSGVHTILPLSSLPSVSATVVIDGQTQPGFTNSPLIEIDGGSAGALANGLNINANGCKLDGLVVDSFGANGIVIFGSGCTVSGCYVGSTRQERSSRTTARRGFMSAVRITPSVEPRHSSGMWFQAMLSTASMSAAVAP